MPSSILRRFLALAGLAVPPKDDARRQGSETPPHPDEPAVEPSQAPQSQPSAGSTGPGSRSESETVPLPKSTLVTDQQRQSESAIGSVSPGGDHVTDKPKQTQTPPHAGAPLDREPQSPRRANDLPPPHPSTTHASPVARTPLHRLGLSEALCIRLREAGITSVETLVSVSESDLLSRRGFGFWSLHEIKQRLADYQARGTSILGGTDHTPRAHRGQRPLAPRLARCTRPLTVLGLGTRLYNALRRAGIRTVGDLARMSWDQVGDIRNIGETSLREIKIRLAKVGASLVGHPDIAHSDAPDVTEPPAPVRTASLAPDLVDCPVPLAALHLSVRAYNGLDRAGIQTVGDLARLSWRDVAEIRNIGERSLRNIRTCLSERRAEILAPTEMAGPTGAAPVTSPRPPSPQPASPQPLPKPASVAEIIADWLRGQKPRDAQILRVRFGLGCERQTLEEVAEIHGLTRQRIAQIQKRALARLTARRSAPDLARCLRQLREYVGRMGGIASAEELASDLPLEMDLGDADPVAAAQLLATIAPVFRWWKSERLLLAEPCRVRTIQAIRKRMRQALKESPDGLPVDDLVFQEANRWLFQDDGEAPSEAFIRACLRTDPKIEISVGVARTVTKKPPHNTALLRHALRQIGHPAHYAEIVQKVNASLPPDQQKDEHSLYGCILRRKDVFVRAGHGIYGLAEWGLSADPSVADAVERVLRAEGRPLLVREIVTRVQETMQYADSSIYQALNDRDRFERVSKGKYALAATPVDAPE